jgi:hypothetical protein
MGRQHAGRIAPRRFRVKYIAAAVIASAALVACGGGGGSVPPFNGGAPAPSATPTPAPAPVYALRWTGATHSTLPQSDVRRVLATTTTSEPIELAVGAQGSLVRQSGAVFGTLQVVATVGGSPAPVPVPSPGAVTVADTTLATVAQDPAPSTSPSPGPLTVADVQSASTTGTTTVTVRLPTGDAPSASVNVYPGFAMECPAGLHPDAVQAYKVAGGALVAASGPADGDVYLTGSNCSDTSTSAVTVHFPYGYATFPGSTPFSAIATVVPFTSAGTSDTVADLAAQASAPSNPIGGLIFKTVTGDYVKVRFAGIGGSPTVAIVGASQVCPIGACPR